MHPGEARGEGSGAAIESAVRAVGRIVVWVHADADVRIANASNAVAACPSTEGPKSVGAIAAKTSSALPGAPSPMPSVPTPAKAIVAVATRT